MCLAVACVVGVVAYRVSTFAALQLLEKDKIDHNDTVSTTTQAITQNASIITTVTAACINVTVIIILNMVSYNFEEFVNSSVSKHVIILLL